MTPTQSGHLRAAVAVERRRIDAQWAKDRLTADCRERLRVAAEAVHSGERAGVWMNSGQLRLGGQRPWNVAVDEDGLSRCLALLRSGTGKR